MASHATKRCGAIALSALATLWAGSALAAPFTGPTSPYYLDNYLSQTIYVVQGTSVINSFPWAYEAGNAAQYNEGNLAVTNVVTTNGSGSAYGSPATAGQYTLGGTPTGVGHVAQATPGTDPGSEVQYDGTSDGRHNYTVQYEATSGGIDVENVIQTDLNWQNPVSLFSVQLMSVPSGAYVGITYDPTNNSLWISGWGTNTITDWSLSGTQLSSFSVPLVGLMGALGLDPADHTLWFAYADGDMLYQYSTSGALLQSGTPSGLTGVGYLAGEFAEASGVPVPEPASLALLLLGLAGVGFVRRRASSDDDTAPVVAASPAPRRHP